MKETKKILSKRLLLVAIMTIAWLFAVPGVANSQDNYSEVRDMLPTRGTEYLIRCPENWNGTLISDLDFYTSAESGTYLYLLDQGYALSGTKRRPNRLSSYDPAHEIHDLISVLDIFEATFGKPTRTIQHGCSGGGTVTLAMAEIHPDRIDGAIAACASTSPWMANTHLDGLFVLKALLAPELPIVDLPLRGPEIEEIAAAWQHVIVDAQKTPEGRARIALAITIGQWAAWGGPGKAPLPEPDPDNIKALQESMYQSLVLLLPSKVTIGTTMLELAAPGQIKGNTRMNYKEAYNNGDEDYRKAVENLYKDAHLSLEADLNQINEFPRISADASAKKWWSSPGRTHIGEPKVPLLRIHTIGDGLVYPSMAEGYEALVAEKGHSELYRSAYVDRWGHCSFSHAEWLTAFEIMMQRLDTGVWPDTDPEALNELGMSLDPGGSARFCHFKGVEKYNRTWLPKASDYVLTQPKLPTANDSLVSTELLAGNKVAIKFFAQEAWTVDLIFDMKRDTIAFKKGSNDVWEGTMSDVQTAGYMGRFVVNDADRTDPKRRYARVTTEVFMRPTEDDFFAMKDDVPRGSVSQRFYYSETLKKMRSMYVWTPAGSERSIEKLPVLYLVHGGGGNDKSWSTVGCAGIIMDNLLAEGKIEPMIVVMPYATIRGEKMLDRLPIFQEDLMTGIIPFIESNYHVQSDGAHRAIMGLSMGGLQTLEMALYNYDKFNYIAALSSGWWISDEWAQRRSEVDSKELRTARLDEIASDFSKSNKLLYFTMGGREDHAYDNGMETMKLFDEAGIKYQYSESPGGHTYMVWRKNLWELAPLLFKK